MLITQELLKEKGAVESIIAYLTKHFPNGAERVDLIKHLQTNERDKFGFTRWLFQEFKITGKFKLWYPDGQLLEESNYMDGQIHGECKLWYDNGQAWVVGNFRHGKPHGNYKKWGYSGRLFSTTTFENGEEQGAMFDK